MNNAPIHDSAAEELIEYPLINNVEGAFDEVVHCRRMLIEVEGIHGDAMYTTPAFKFFHNDHESWRAIGNFWQGVDHAYAETMYLY